MEYNMNYIPYYASVSGGRLRLASRPALSSDWGVLCPVVLEPALVNPFCQEAL